MMAKRAKSKDTPQRSSLIHIAQRQLNVHPLLCFAVLGVIWTALLYQRVVFAPFVYDDVTAIQNNSALSHIRSALGYFRVAVQYSGDFSSIPQTYYRPLVWLSFALDESIWGLNAFGFHLSNVVLHCLNGFLGFLLLKHLRVAISTAITASLLWIGLPVNSEAVAWISGRPYCLATFFLLITLLSAISYVKLRSWWSLVCVLIASAASGLSHEMGILALPLTMLTLIVLRDFSWQDWINICGTLAAGDCLYLLLRGLSGATAPIVHLKSILMMGVYFFKYIGWMALPVRMSVERSTDAPPFRVSFVTIACLLGLLGVVASTVYLRPRLQLISATTTWLLIALLPYCGVVFIYQGMAERYVYLASAGFAVSIAATLRILFRRKSLVGPLLLVWLFWGAWKVNARVSEWSDDISLYKSSLQATPNSWILLLNLGNAYLQGGNYQEAATKYQRALSIQPNAVKAAINLGAALQMSGDVKGAREAYERAIRVDPKVSDVYCNLGALVFQQGDKEYAARLLSQAVQLDPRNASAYFDLGILYGSNGDLDRAEAFYRKVLEINPSYPDAQRALDGLVRRKH